MKLSIIINVFLLSTFALSSTAIAKPKAETKTIEQAVYVAFQDIGMFTYEDINSARTQVYQRALDGDKYAKKAAEKLSNKLTKQLVAKR